MKTLQQLYDRHPNLVLWAGLALGMVIILAISARNVGFTASQWAALLAATVALAGLCVWIISWESDGENAVEGDSNIVPPNPARTQGEQSHQD